MYFGVQFIKKRNYSFSECKTNTQADILFLIDGSGSVRSDGFKEALDFMQRIARMFFVAADKTQFGLVVFGDTVDTVFDFDTYTSISLLEDAIERTPYEYI